ncbi:MAG: molybdenum cofactor biosynthesis protein MoaA [Sulfuricurvum sp. PC08-66]|nr:MAG: molybdenum cofactor biosynthesis protein MoaA [Sulfuricurvum sp. PC08-66]
MSKRTFAQSMQALDAMHIAVMGYEKVPLSQSLGRTLAHDVVAPHDSPSAPTAAMDGYAILGADQASGTIALIGHDNPAGGAIDTVVTQGWGLKTFTGSLMPAGADTLIPIENVTVEGGKIRIDTPVREGFSVRSIGENYAKGETLITQGTVINYAAIGVMASLGMAMVDVVQRPKVAILSTGSEIMDVGECATNAAQIYSSNHYTLASLIEQWGGQAVQLGTARDDYATIKSRIEEALASCDMVVTTGGVSVGDYDFVRDIVPALGGELVFQGVLLKPGQHLILAQKGNKLIIALPGFAYSSTVTFMLYGAPLLARLLGRVYAPTIVEAIMDVPYAKKSNKTEFVACRVRLVEGVYHVDFEGKKSGSSAILTNMLGSTALLMLDEGEVSLSVGARVRLQLIDIL